MSGWGRRRDGRPYKKTGSSSGTKRKGSITAESKTTTSTKKNHSNNPQTLMVTCKQCGEKNNMLPLLDILRGQKLDRHPDSVAIMKAMEKINLKCGNCFMEMK